MKKKYYLWVALFITKIIFAAPLSPMMTKEKNSNDITPYKASDLSLEEIDSLWNRMRNDHYEKSVCADRAMVWSYELKRDHDVDSMKTFIHFTDIFKHVVDNNGEHIGFGRVGRFFRNYVSRKPVIWHYHVAPSLLSEGNIIVLDKMYAKNPWTLEEWETRFIRGAIKILNDRNKREDLISNLRENIAREQDSSSSKDQMKLKLDQASLRLIRSSYNKETGKYEPKCKRITHIIEHDLHNYDAWCHLQQTTPAYWNQRELRLLNYNSTYIIRNASQYDIEDQTKGSKNMQIGFDPAKVKSSYNDAFGVSL